MCPNDSLVIRFVTSIAATGLLSTGKSTGTSPPPHIECTQWHNKHLYLILYSISTACRTLKWTEMKFCGDPYTLYNVL